MDLIKLIKEKKAQGEWGSIYMIIIAAIAAVLILAIVKPMFKESQSLSIQKPIVVEQAQTNTK